MSTSKHIDKICIAVTAIMLVITVLFSFGESLGLSVMVKAMPYESTLFDTSYVHTIDIVMDDWDSFIETCENEEYTSCTVVIDGTSHSNIAIRAKGNTSLSTVSTLNSDRYSFKLEFDHYDSSNTLDGLDKLCLNNLIQDYTMMKDFIVYQLMNDFGVDSPLCSFVYLTVNGEDWGLYLAVEGIEDSFLSRNYGSSVGDLYKPDSISNGGGRGNGKDFNMDDFDFGDAETDGEETQATKETTEQSEQTTPGGQIDPTQQGNMQGGMQGGMPGGMQGGQQGGMQGEMPSGQQGGMPDGQQGNFDPTQQGGQQGGMPGGQQGGLIDPNQQGGQQGNVPGGFDPSQQGNGNSSMNGDDVKLKYIDDDADSYSNIFDNAKTNVTKADEKRLIKALKNLNSYTNLEDTVDIEEVIRYFVVHNFVCNGDSYTGSMIHNYYLYEEDGILSMIPWDYNLAYGTFQGGNASDTVNTSIDSPVSNGTVDDRPMLGWIFSNESYTELYHELFAEFIEKWFTNGELEKLISDTAEMIRPYVEKDPTKFCTTEEFDAGVDALSEFVTLRAEAVSNQLDGDTTKVDVGDLNLSDMGTMNAGGNGGMGGMENPINRNTDILSFVSLKDADGNSVSVTDVIPSTAKILSLTLSDGTTVDLSSADMQTLMSVDVSKIKSVCDSDGNVYDLSAYTISTSFPVQPNGDGTGEGNIPTQPSGDETAEGNPPTQPSGDETGENNPTTQPSGDMPTLDTQNGGQMPDRQMGDDAKKEMPSGDFGGMEAESTDAAKWILVCVSFIALGIGLYIALKKKY